MSRSYDKDRPVVVLGGGGHARVLLDALALLGRPVRGYTDAGGRVRPELGVPCLGSDAALRDDDREHVYLVNGVGGVGDTGPRRRLFEAFKEKGFTFLTLVHPRAVVAPSADLGEGVQVMAGAVVQAGSRVGDDTIINTGAVVDHDCAIGAHVHLAPGVTLSGGVHVGDGAHVGTGATLIQQVRVGRGARVGAAALVLRDVPEGATVFGVPAKERST